MNKIGLITIAPFPIGNVTTVRYSSYLKSLVENGDFAKVYIYTPTRMACKVTKLSGEYNGIKYQYTSVPTLKLYNLPNRIFYLIKGLINSCKHIKRDNIETLIITEEQPFLVFLFYRLVCSIYGLRYIWEKTEYPPIAVRKNSLKEFIYMKRAKLVDGIIVITDELIKYFGKFKPSSNLMLLPVTIDTNRFANAERENVSVPYMAAVFGIHNRDGLEETLLAFSKYKQLGGSYRLHLVGNFDKMPNAEKLKKIISDNSISEEVQILGLIPIEKVPNILCNAACLVTTPNFYISGGFPTKLAEYMLSGVPIIATNAGEVSNYIANREDMLIEAPGDLDSIASAMLYIEKNPKIGNELAQNAKRKASVIFNAHTYVKDLHNFLIKNA